MTVTKKFQKPILLTILDGWGYREEWQDNAIAQAETPNWDGLWNNAPHALLDASELQVGLPVGQMGNSEVGHMNIGAGRVVLQDLPRIDAAIADGSLAQNLELKKFIASLLNSEGACHLLGLLSDGGVHSSSAHLLKLAEIISAAGVPVWLHAFLDGRDTPPKSALAEIQKWQDNFANNSLVKIATLSGRYYAMDRDNRWERVEKAWLAIVLADAVHENDAQIAIEKAYAANITDEFILPISLAGFSGVKAGDGLLMANFRADRAREILHALVDTEFSGFARKQNYKFAALLGMCEYSRELANIPALFPAYLPRNCLAEILAEHNLTQLHIAETEKYAHVTFFFNGGREEKFAGEERILVPSPKVATYDLQPEMSAYMVTEELEKAIAAGKYDFIVVNYANTDMVGHSGDLSAAKLAVQTVDNCLGRLKNAIDAAGGIMLITADHGNAELMRDLETQQPHTAHTLNKVPLVLYGVKNSKEVENYRLQAGCLADIAPTILELLGVLPPEEMTGKSLLRF